METIGFLLVFFLFIIKKQTLSAFHSKRLLSDVAFVFFADILSKKMSVLIFVVDRTGYGILDMRH